MSLSVRLLTSLLKLDKCRGKSFSGWDNFLIFFQIFLGCVYFQIIKNFLYVCQSISWLTSLLKLDKYRENSSSWWEIFLNFFEIQIILNFMYVCQSVCLLTSLPKLDRGISPVLDGVYFWNFLEAFPICWYIGSK